MAEEKETKPEEETPSEEESAEPTLESLLTEAASLEQAPTPVEGEEKPEEKAKGEEAQEEKEEEKPPPSTDFSAPEVQEHLRGFFNQWLQSNQEQAKTDASAADIGRLVEEGDQEELGRRFIEEFRRGKDRSAIEREVLTNFLGGYYTRLFQNPALQNLTAEEKSELDPRKAASDLDYMFTLSEFVQKKEFTTRGDGIVEERVKARIEAAKKGGVPDRLSKASGATVPSGNAAKGDVPDSEKSGEELLGEGLSEMLKDYVT